MTPLDWSPSGMSATETLAELTHHMLAAGVFREREADEWQRQQIIERWQNAGRSILSSVRMVRNAETLGDKYATGAER